MSTRTPEHGHRRDHGIPDLSDAFNALYEAKDWFLNRMRVKRLGESGDPTHLSEIIVSREEGDGLVRVEHWRETREYVANHAGHWSKEQDDELKRAIEADQRAGRFPRGIGWH